MRSNVLFAVALGITLVCTTSLALYAADLRASLPDVPNPGDEGELTIALSCSAVGDDYRCRFDVTSNDPAYIVFRWDFEGDGVWDYPDQTGGGTIGRWTLQTAAVHLYTVDGAYRSYVQGWDGSSIRIDENGIPRADGPEVFADHFIGGNLGVHPQKINAKAQGRWVNIVFGPPSDVDPDDIDELSVSLAGISTKNPVRIYPTGSDGIDGWTFKVDRATLVTALGKGTHVVYLRGVWATGTFLAASTVQIV